MTSFSGIVPIHLHCSFWPLSLLSASLRLYFSLLHWRLNFQACLFVPRALWHYGLFRSCILSMRNHSIALSVLPYPLSCPFPPVSPSLCSPTRMWNCSTSCERKNRKCCCSWSAPKCCRTRACTRFLSFIKHNGGKSKRTVTALSVSLCVPLYRGLWHRRILVINIIMWNECGLLIRWSWVHSSVLESYYWALEQDS